MTDTAGLFEEARRYIPGGVNSPVRAFGSVGGTPVFVRRARGAYVFGEDDLARCTQATPWLDAVTITRFSKHRLVAYVNLCHPRLQTRTKIS